MKNIRLLIITLFFSGLLTGCGMKGPLYRTPVAQPTPAAMENTETPQDKATTATTEELTNCSGNTAAADKQQTVTETDKATADEQKNCSENTAATGKRQTIAEQDKPASE